MSDFFVKQILLAPSGTVKNDFDFNTIIEKFFDFNGDCDSLVYSLPGSLGSPVYSPQRSLDSPEYHQRSIISGVSLIRLPGVSTTGESPRCIPYRGVETPLYVHHRGVVSTVFSCFNGLPWPLKEESLKSNYG